jgi:hypothetical protein
VRRFNRYNAELNLVAWAALLLVALLAWPR